MPLAAGTRLGPYEIVASLGAGGMGEIYRARDTRLGRQVAVKVLPQEFATTDRLQRFEQEARAVAALNHPNILALYDVGEDAGTPFLVTELLEGRTLARVLADERPSIARSLDLATQAAAGLAAAHARGIVHRDVKPDNLFVTADGRLKILDFGLVKSLDHDAESETQLGTASHTVLGTPRYMAPEQVRGEAVDHRADLFAFGAVLYEMVSGRPAFPGQSTQEILASVLRDPPPPLVSTSDQPITPGLALIVARCLEKSRAARFQSTTDLEFALKMLPSGSMSDGTGATRVQAIQSGRTVSSARRSSARWWKTGAAAIVLIALGAIAGWWFGAGQQSSSSTERTTALRLQIPLRPPLLWAPRRDPTRDQGTPGDRPIAISSDGRQIVFAAVDSNSGVRSLYVRDFTDLEPRPLENTDNARQPFFSPDANRIGFFTDGRLKWIATSGGPAHDICAALSPAGGAWAEDDHIIFAPEEAGGLFRVSVNDAKPQQLTTPASNGSNASDRFPHVLPGATAVLYQTSSSSGGWQIVAQALPSGKPVPVVEGSSPQFSQGYLVYSRQGEVFARPFDASRLTVGTPVPLSDRPGFGDAISVSANGTLIYLPLVASPGTLVRIDRQGVERPIPAPRRRYSTPRISGDGKKTLVRLPEGVGLVDLATGFLEILPTGAASAPAWGPDERTITFGSGRNPAGTYTQRIDGEHSPVPLFPMTGELWLYSWSRDSRALLFDNVGRDTESDTWILKVGEPRGPQNPRKLPGNSTKADYNQGISADGQWRAVVSGVNGQPSLYVFAFPDGALPEPAAVGGVHAKWAREGNELFFRRVDGPEIWAVKVSGAGGKAVIDPARFVLKLPDLQPVRNQPGAPSYDVFPDGSFLYVKEPPAPPAEAIVVVLNFVSALVR